MSIGWPAYFLASAWIEASSVTSSFSTRIVLVAACDVLEFGRGIGAGAPAITFQPLAA